MSPISCAAKKGSNLREENWRRRETLLPLEWGAGGGKCTERTAGFHGNASRVNNTQKKGNGGVRVGNSRLRGRGGCTLFKTDNENIHRKRKVSM